MAHDEKEPADFDTAVLYQRFREVRTELIDDTLFLVDRQEKAIHALDPVSAAIWGLLVEPWSADEAGKLVAEAFPEQPVESVLEDVEQVYADLESYNLIRVVG